MGDKFQISPASCILWAGMLLILPLRFCMAVLLAAAFHELFHLVVIRLLGGQVLKLSIHLFGAMILTGPMSRGREALAALAGPMGSFSLLFFTPLFPELAIIACLQGLYNLMPVYPLDGGRALRSLLSEPVCAAIEGAVLVLLLGLGIWLSFQYQLGLLPLLPGFLALCQRLTRK